MNIMPNKLTRKKAARKRFWMEAIIASRFGLIGIIATFIHVLVISILLSETQLPILMANTLAFLGAFSISFTGNYFWTFESPGDLSRAMWRFLLISASAFLVNTLILVILIRVGWLTPFLSAIFSATVIPVITFLASRLWGFRYVRREVDRPGRI